MNEYHYMNAERFAVVEGIAKELGEGWSAKLPDWVGPDNPDCRSAELVHTDGRVIYAHPIGTHWNFASSRSLPYEVYIGTDERALGMASKFETNATTSKTPAQMAKDIGRKIIPGYTLTYEHALVFKRRQDARDAAQAASLQRLHESAAGISVIDTDRNRDNPKPTGLSYKYMHNLPVNRFDFTPSPHENGEVTYDIKVDDLPEETVLQILAMIAALVPGGGN